MHFTGLATIWHEGWDLISPRFADGKITGKERKGLSIDLQEEWQRRHPVNFASMSLLA